MPSTSSPNFASINPLDERADLVVLGNPLHPTLISALVSGNLTEPPVSEAHTPLALKHAPSARDPSLPSTGKPLSYVDIFVDDFIGLAQEYSNSHWV